MKMLRSLKTRVRQMQSQRQQTRILQLGDPGEITRQDWTKSLSSPAEFYDISFRYFHARLPENLRSHRQYFAQNGRGFGEAAFHTMWFLIFREFAPKNFLEIGVYRGQVLSLAALLQKNFQIDGEVVGISPFSSVGDSVSKYIDLDYYEDTLANFSNFGLDHPELVKAYSTDEIAKDAISSRTWDCIYIDGNHDYDVVKEDWANCSGAVAEGGLIVFDDASLYTSYQGSAFSTAGHPGPSRMADEVDPDTFVEILRVGHNRVFQKR